MQPPILDFEAEAILKTANAQRAAVAQLETAQRRERWVLWLAAGLSMLLSMWLMSGSKLPGTEKLMLTAAFMGMIVFGVSNFFISFRLDALLALLKAKDRAAGQVRQHPALRE